MLKHGAAAEEALEEKSSPIDCKTETSSAEFVNRQRRHPPNSSPAEVVTPEKISTTTVKKHATSQGSEVHATEETKFVYFSPRVEVPRNNTYEVQRNNTYEETVGAGHPPN